MSSPIAYEKVANMLNQWYSSIKQHNISAADAKKEEIQPLLDSMDENQDVLLYYNLLDARYLLLKEEYSKSGGVLDELEKTAEEHETDDMIQYYFFFFSGMYAYYKKQYTKAIMYYKIAEERLKRIPDEIEKAEFHYYLSKAYYQIDQNHFSLVHAEIAYDTFKAHDTYKEKTINCEMMLGANKLDLLLFEEAEKHYESARTIAKANDFRYSESLALFNLGIAYERRKMFAEASTCFEQAWTIPEHIESFVGVRSAYMLSKVLFQLGDYELARTWNDKALKKATAEGEREYLAKLKLIHSLYEKQNDQEVRQNIEVLEKMQLWSETADLSIEIAEYYKNRDDFEKAAYYFEHGHFAKDKVIQMSEALM
ncbi:tetratricopeptide repeat protein [Bacillus velezensis]|uniref:response regulator aspartate phosphatase n=1 Tax=Bacillus velezensis TaxID=492670 RepID=UPI0038733D99